MSDRRRVMLVLAALAVATALPAAADVFTVQLVGGASLETRYKPIEDPEDGSKVMLLTDQGNWISLAKSTVVDVTSQTELKGFGLVIDSQTVFLGISANDLAEPGEEGPLDPTAQLLQMLQGQQQAEPYSVPQFVNTEEAGGIPVQFLQQTTPPLGGGRFSAPPRR